MSSTTNINDLPLDPTGGNLDNNVHMSATETKTTYDPNLGSSNEQSTNNNNNPIALDISTINQIVNGLQQANGVTQLTSRDIPMTTENLTQDPYIKANYIPDVNNTDYITEEMDKQRYIDGFENNERMNDTLESTYEQIQIPILLALLYFLFQLPVFKTIIFKYFPFFCNIDGNYNLNGLLVTSLLFGVIYYIFTKTKNIFERF